MRSGANRCFLEQVTFHLLPKTGWFQERVYKPIASFTIELKELMLNLYKLEHGGDFILLIIFKNKRYHTN